MSQVYVPIFPLPDLTFFPHTPLEELDVERRFSRLAEALDDLFTQLTGDR